MNPFDGGELSEHSNECEYSAKQFNKTGLPALIGCKIIKVYVCSSTYDISMNIFNIIMTK